MLTLRILAFLSLVPAVYPLTKLLKRMDLNTFDFLLLFSSLYYCIIPLISGQQDYEVLPLISDAKFQIYVYLYYNFFAYSLGVISFVWSNSAKSEDASLINLTSFVRRYLPVLPFPKKALWLFILFLVLGWVHYAVELKTKAVVVNMSYNDMREKLAESSSYQGNILNTLFKSTYQFMYMLFFFYLFSQYLRGIRVLKLEWAMLASFILLSFLGSRTRALGDLLFLALLYYSIYKDHFKWKVVISGLVGLYMVVLIFFPLVNLYRYSVRYFGAELEDKSFTETVSLIVDNMEGEYEAMKKETEGAVSSRSTAVIQALALAFAQDMEPEYGNLTANAVSISMPKVIYPNKSTTGSQIIIESKLGTFTDTADTVLMFNKVEWGFVGTFASVILYFLLFKAWDLMTGFAVARSDDLNIAVFGLFNIFALCQFIEVSVDQCFANLIQAPICFVLLWLLLTIWNKLFFFSKNQYAW